MTETENQIMFKDIPSYKRRSSDDDVYNESHTCTCQMLYTQGLNPGVKPRSPALQADSLLAEPQGKLALYPISMQLVDMFYY